MTNTRQPLMNQDVKKNRLTAADKWRTSRVAADCKRIVLGLNFLKCSSDAFDERRTQLLPLRYVYPTDQQEEATKMVRWGAESLSAEWAIG